MTAQRYRLYWLIAIVIVTLFYTASRAHAQPGTVLPYPAPLGPKKITDDADDPHPPPPGYTPMLAANKRVIVPGLIMFGASYAVSAVLATGDPPEDENGVRKNDYLAMVIPVAGPFVTLSKVHTGKEQIILASLGTAQVLGLAVLGYGLLTPRRVFVRDDLVRRRVTITPVASRAMSGLALSGQF